MKLLRTPIRTLTASTLISAIAGATLIGCGTDSLPTSSPIATLDDATSSAPTQWTPSEPSTAPPEATPAPAEVIPENTAQTLLSSLPVKGRAPKTGYGRDNFGQRWSDDVTVEFGHNGCDTRNDILNRDLINKVYKPNTRDCVVLSGTLNDPYTATAIDFQRGAATSNQVQIDHVVALSDAWQKGAQQLSVEKRQDFANDPLNLLAVEGRANQQKGDGDAATWLPKNSAFRCQYVGRQVLVKTKYQLWVTDAEAQAMDRWLQTCSPEDVDVLNSLSQGVSALSDSEFEAQ